MQNLIIVGAGQFGREIYTWAKQCGSFNPKVFLDANSEALGIRKGYPLLIASIESYEPMEGDVFICAIGNPSVRANCVRILQMKGAIFVSIIHPSVVFAENVKIGAGVIICPYSVVSADASVEDFAIINLQVSIGHDAKVGKFAQINPHASIGGFAVIGNFSTVGSNASILPHAKVGEGANVGAGSVVLRSVPAGQTVFGVPAKPFALPSLQAKNKYEK